MVTSGHLATAAALRNRAKSSPLMCTLICNVRFAMASIFALDSRFLKVHNVCLFVVLRACECFMVHDTSPKERIVKTGFYVNLLIEEWGISGYPRLCSAIRSVLLELNTEAQLTLRREARLQVVVLPDAGFSVWAYFPVHRRRRVIRDHAIQLKPGARILLLIDKARIEAQSRTTTKAELRDHLGHILLYLRSPKARNDCSDAMKEWAEACARD